MADLQIYNLQNVFRLRNRLMEEVCSDYHCCTLEGPDFQSFVEHLWSNYLPAGASLEAVFESLRGVAGVELSQSLIEETMWRLAGNLSSLKQGRSVHKWTSQAAEEWVPAQIVRASPGLNHKRQPGYFFTFRVLAGTPCPMLIHKHWTRSVCAVAAKHTGHSKRNGKYPYRHPLQLVGLRLYCLVTPKLSRNGQPGFFKTECPPSCIRYNREILTTRLGERPLSCPRKYIHECHKCTVGYIECVGGTHRENYVKSFCSHCGQISVFDSEDHSDKCVPCLERIQLQRKA
jgi:hypothetical protein